MTFTSITSLCWLISIGICIYQFFTSQFDTAEFVFSNPTIILGAQKREPEKKKPGFRRELGDGIVEIDYYDKNLLIVDDYREAYAYLRENAPGARIVSWWDYGYQLSQMSGLITYNDNNTNDEKKIAKIGELLVKDEKSAYKLMKELRADYVMISYGGNVGLSGDDINKMLWIMRIVQEELGTVRSDDYFNVNGSYLVTSDGSKTFHESMIYKLSYYRIDQLTGGKKYDITRKATLDTPPVELEYFEEVFSSANLLIRIYRPKVLLNW